MGVDSVSEFYQDHLFVLDGRKGEAVLPLEGLTKST